MYSQVNGIKIMDTFKFHQGSLPLLISMPHNGRDLAPEIEHKFTNSALKLADTDWFMQELYAFTKDFSCSIITPLFSRYIIDLNRSPENTCLYKCADESELCPTKTFSHEAIYKGAPPGADEVNERLEKYYWPYHNRLKEWITEAKESFGMALIYEAHSIKSQVPRFFEGKLADLNLGTFDGKSCDERLEEIVWQEMQDSNYSCVSNGRFKGGYITRHYARASESVFTLQMEISQSCYLNEETLQVVAPKFDELQGFLKGLFEKIILWVTTYGKV